MKCVQVGIQELDAKHHFLLNHDQLMTPRLEQFYKEKLHLKVLETKKKKNALRRTILLSSEKQVPREYSLVHFYLGNMKEEMRNEIIAQKMPFAKILQKHKTKTFQKTRRFFKIKTDEKIKNALQTKADFLFGKKYRISTKNGKKLAEVVVVVN